MGSGSGNYVRFQAPPIISAQKQRFGGRSERTPRHLRRPPRPPARPWASSEKRFPRHFTRHGLNYLVRIAAYCNSSPVLQLEPCCLAQMSALIPSCWGNMARTSEKKKERFHRGIKFPFFPWKELIKLDRSINQCPTTTTLHFRRTASDFLRPPQTGAQPWGTTAWHWWIYWAIPRGPDISVHPQLDYGQNPFLFFCWLA